MKLEQQVCSLELAKKLKELGVKQESLFCWQYFEPTPAKYENPVWNLKYCQHTHGKETYWEHISAFTVAELGEMLPQDKSYKLFPTKLLTGQKFLNGGRYVFKNNWGIKIDGFDLDITFEQNTEADVRARLLIYLLENKLNTTQH